MKKCVIISGAPDCNTDFLKSDISSDAYIICADSGYLACIDAGLTPSLVIGDFDSSPRPDIDCEIIHLEREKAHTDTFSAVITAIERGYDDIDVYNAIGSRFDHSYANVLMLSYCHKRNAKCRIIGEKNRISLIDGRGVINRDYDNFSLFAFLGNAEGVRIEGAYYTAGFYGRDALDVNQDDLITQCNYVSDDFAVVTAESGILLLVESND